MRYVMFLLLLCFFSCSEGKKSDFQSVDKQITKKTGVSLYILGTVQDGGSPHVGCAKNCCVELFKNPDPTRKVVSLGIIDHEQSKFFLFEATPDITSQLKSLANFSLTDKQLPDGIFLTHAHMGHYTGLMYLGREAMGAKQVSVYAMPRMKSFLETNGPWSQLVTLGNIRIEPLEHEKSVQISNNIKVEPILVPHRDEYSETVGYRISGPNKSALFIPDIDKWHKWDKDIIQQIKEVDFAFLDATFYDGEEINTRNIEEIPHPFVVESLGLFRNLLSEEKAKIHFIHFNHTNALLDQSSDIFEKVTGLGFKVCEFGQQFSL